MKTANISLKFQFINRFPTDKNATSNEEDKQNLILWKSF